MRIEVYRYNSDLKRERWDFYLSIDHEVRLFFDGFTFETKASTRHRKWKCQAKYNRLMKQESTLSCPRIPQDVISEVKSKINQSINETEVCY